MNDYSYKLSGEMQVNKVILEGIVESDPNVRYFGYSHVRADFILRTKETFPPQREGDEPKEQELRHVITAWGDIAQLIEESVQEGQTLHVEGRLTYDKNTNRQGEVRIFPVVDCQQITILSKPSRFESATSSPLDSPKELDWSQFAPSEDEDPMM